MTHPLRILLLEDRETDALLITKELERCGFIPTCTRAADEAAYLAQLGTEPEIILADYALPQFDALRALHLLKERAIDIPFVIVSGAIGEEQAVTVMKDGAADYVLKDRMARLGPAVSRALEQKALRDEARAADQNLRRTRAALSEANESLRHLSSRLMRLQDEERQRIALELHDGCAQTLTVLNLTLGTLQQSDGLGTVSGASRLVAESIALVEQVCREIRAISHSLHPSILDQMGLVPALRGHVKDLIQRTGLTVSLSIDELPSRLPPAAELGLFRIVQEFLAALRYSPQSRSAAVTLQCDEQTVSLTLACNDTGISPEVVKTYESALLSIRERVRDWNGRVDMHWHSSGPEITVSIPVSWA